MPSNRYPIAKGINNYFKSDKLKEIKNSLLKGDQHPYCKSCWDAEDNNVKSHRHNKGRAYSHKYIDSIHIDIIIYVILNVEYVILDLVPHG